MCKKILIFTTLFFVLVHQLTYGQSVDENLVKLADEMYGFGDKKDALGVYLQALEINPDNVMANYMAGKCYLETIDKGKSVEYFLKAYELKKNVAPDILFKIASGYHLGEKFDEAISYYKRYKEELTEAKANALKSSVKDEVIKTDRRIYECQNAKHYYKNPIRYRIENIKDVVNSEYPDYAPAITADQTTMVFTSRRAGGVGKNKDFDNEYFEDVWITTKENGEWTAPKNIGPPINTVSHDASIGFSQDGKTLFLYKPDNAGDIYMSTQLPGGKWSKPVNIGPPINSRSKELSVSISADGKTIYFSSDRPGGFGNFDIYKAELQPNGKWGKPQNLGSAINTEYDEDSPYIDSDGKTLYFSSRGHKGMGGYDIYKVEYDAKRKTWGEPINMGYPINSPDDDIYFVIAGDGKTGYYASAKSDGYGDKDIYMIDLSKIEEEKPTPVKTDSTPVALKTPAKPTPADTQSQIEEPNKKPLEPTKTKDNTQPRPNDNPLKNNNNQQEKPKEEPGKSTPITPVKPEPNPKPSNQPTPTTTDDNPTTKNATIPDPSATVSNEKTPPTKKPETNTTPNDNPTIALVTKPTPGVEKNITYNTPDPAASTRKEIPVGPAPNSKPVAKPTPKTSDIPISAATPVYPTIVKGNISDHYTGEPLIATIVVQDMYGNVIKTTNSDAEGNYSIELTTSEPTKTNFTVTKDGYIYANINVLIPKDAIQRRYMQRDFTLKRAEIGQTFILRNIYYDFNQAVIKKESYIYLNKLVAWLKANPSIHLEIGGHTDDIGPREQNRILSQKRVEAVKQYLIKNGISPERMIAIGYGEDRPLATNDDEIEGREINRRTEFKIIKR